MSFGLTSIDFGLLSELFGSSVFMELVLDCESVKLCYELGKSIAYSILKEFGDNNRRDAILF